MKSLMERLGNQGAVVNARKAATELSRRRVQWAEAEQEVARLARIQQRRVARPHDSHHASGA